MEMLNEEEQKKSVMESMELFVQDRLIQINERIPRQEFDFLIQLCSYNKESMRWILNTETTESTYVGPEALC